jgi:glyoxylase-like metal-dependent hydrolase (beta-lactamase superfamily II)
MTQLIHTESALEGLFASAPEPLPFDSDLEIRAFVLKRDQGNLLVYSVRGLESDAEAIGDIGGISRHYLNHRHEAIFSSDWVEAPLFVHEKERAAVEKEYHVRATFSRRHTLEGDFEAIPIPGHTSGATAYLWDSGRHRFLFTGDTIHLRQGEWHAAVLGSSDRESYIESLELMKGLDFDVLVPWAATSGQDYYAITSQADAQRRIDAIVERVRRGADH